MQKITRNTLLESHDEDADLSPVIAAQVPEQSLAASRVLNYSAAVLVNDVVKAMTDFLIHVHLRIQIGCNVFASESVWASSERQYRLAARP
jgi:hypothetical protein